jgi:hypothetical protein
VPLKQRDWCLLLSWCLAVRLVSSVGWWLQRSVRVGRCLPGFVLMGIGVSNRLVPMKICKSRSVPIEICINGDWRLQ